jgi:hypothetical protein
VQETTVIILIGLTEVLAQKTILKNKDFKLIISANQNAIPHAEVVKVN